MREGGVRGGVRGRGEEGKVKRGRREGQKGKEGKCGVGILRKVFF